MASTVGVLEPPESLLQALTTGRANNGSTLITDLPAVLIGSILSRLSNPLDIASAFCASRLFWAMARYAPFRLKLRPIQFEEGTTTGGGRHPCRNGYDAQKIGTWTRSALAGIRAVMQSTLELDLGGCLILDEDVAAVLLDLRCLDRLVLDGCQKLTSAVADALALSVRSGPRVISLQRCFRLVPAAAGNLVAAAAADRSHLQSLLLSHLDRLDIPTEAPLLEPLEDGSEREIGEYVEVLKSTGSTSIGPGLRILALHNCGGIGSSELAAVSESCPLLELLMLGGSLAGLELVRSKIKTATSVLIKTVESLSRLVILETTFLSASIVQAVREHVRKTVHVWDFCEKNSVIEATAAVLTRCQRCHLISAVEGYLRVVPENPTMSVERNCQRGDILMALRAGANCSDMRRRTPLHMAASEGDATIISSLLTIGASAKGMKDTGGATALFVAAESGHALGCDLLLKGGADVLASNRAGETPLYIAALRGHSEAVEVMLSHCYKHDVNWQDADVYGDGWTPLMAATVADRQDVGTVILRAATAIETVNSGDFLCGHESSTSQKADKNSEFKKFGRDETVKKMNQLGSNSVAQALVEARRPASRLLDAQNRYGQTALHIAARGGAMWFVVNLLRAGASVNIRDQYGSRAVDVASRESHLEVERALKGWEYLQKKKVDDQNKASSSKHSSANERGPTTRKKVQDAEGISGYPSSQKGQPSVTWAVKSSPIAIVDGNSDHIPIGASCSVALVKENMELLCRQDTPVGSSSEHLNYVERGHLSHPAVDGHDVEHGLRVSTSQHFRDPMSHEFNEIPERSANVYHCWRGRDKHRKTSDKFSSSKV